MHILPLITGNIGDAQGNIEYKKKAWNHKGV